MLCCMDYLWFLTFSATFRFFREIMYLLCSIFTFWIYPLNQAMWFSVDFTNYFLPQHKRNNRFHGIMSKSTVQCTVWKRTSKFDQDKKFREINSLVTSLEKPLISRKNVNFPVKIVIAFYSTLHQFHILIVKSEEETSVNPSPYIHFTRFLIWHKLKKNTEIRGWFREIFGILIFVWRTLQPYQNESFGWNFDDSTKKMLIWRIFSALMYRHYTLQDVGYDFTFFFFFCKENFTVCIIWFHEIVCFGKTYALFS